MTLNHSLTKKASGESNFHYLLNRPELSDVAHNISEDVLMG